MDKPDTTRKILRRILERTDLTPKEKLVGAMLAAHLHGSTQTVRVSRARMMAETGLSPESIKRALKGLLSKQILTRKRTGRAAIFAFDGVTQTPSERVTQTPSTLMISHMQTQQPTPRPHAPSPMRENLRSLEAYKRDALAN